MDSIIEIPSQRSKRRWILYGTCLCLLCVATTFQVAYYYQREIALYFYILNCLSIGGGVYAWCYVDAKERKFTLSQTMKVAIGLFGIIGVPTFFIKTRGFKVAAKSVFGLSLYVPFYILYYAVWMLAVKTLHAIGYFS